MARNRGRSRHPASHAGGSPPAPRTNPRLQAAILEVVDNQLQAGEPPETRQTFDRLIAAGYAPVEARRLIGCVVVSEIFAITQRQQSYDAARFVAALHRLPTLPWEDEAPPDRS